MLTVGRDAPTFELEDQNGQSVSLSEYAGSRIVLYFYPKAKTGGCTIEAQGFRDQHDEFAARDIKIIGVSTDPVSLLSEFATEEELPFTLLADEDGNVATAYDALSESGTTERTTYIIGPDGTVEYVYTDVDPTEHAEQVLQDARKMESARRS